ncbi:hypothetical protein HELRODRAFT_176183 [Helobdella robusta]|uniref:Uncharacterized protein n=1 Tax=Helobdella robusta TaxID=6412 RepID=T1FA97_HELRO|nr:hypothetical protein HELRODRAFT_176183 [Helobdella robusta]ESO00315.1 hypothetical protein HELRODRAFT_176183 [Helobdella robusta]
MKDDVPSTSKAFLISPSLRAENTAFKHAYESNMNVLHPLYCNNPSSTPPFCNISPFDKFINKPAFSKRLTSHSTLPTLLPSETKSSFSDNNFNYFSQNNANEYFPNSFLQSSSFGITNPLKETFQFPHITRLTDPAYENYELTEIFNRPPINDVETSDEENNCWSQDLCSNNYNTPKFSQNNDSKIKLFETSSKTSTVSLIESLVSSGTCESLTFSFPLLSNVTISQYPTSTTNSSSNNNTSSNNKFIEKKDNDKLGDENMIENHKDNKAEKNNQQILDTSANILNNKYNVDNNNLSSMIKNINYCCNNKNGTNACDEKTRHFFEIKSVFNQYDCEKKIGKTLDQADFEKIIQESKFKCVTNNIYGSTKQNVNVSEGYFLPNSHFKQNKVQMISKNNNYNFAKDVGNLFLASVSNNCDKTVNIDSSKRRDQSGVNQLTAVTKTDANHTNYYHEQFDVDAGHQQKELRSTENEEGQLTAVPLYGVASIPMAVPVSSC